MHSAHAQTPYVHIPQVGTSTHMVTTEMMATPSAHLAPGSPMDPRLQRVM